MVEVITTNGRQPLFRTLRLLMGLIQQADHHSGGHHLNAQLSQDAGRGIVDRAHQIARGLHGTVPLPQVIMSNFALGDDGLHAPNQKNVIAWSEIAGIGLQLLPIYDHQADLNRPSQLSKSVRVLEGYALNVIFVRAKDSTIDVRINTSNGELAATFVAHCIVYAERLGIRYSELGFDRPLAQVIKHS